MSKNTKLYVVSDGEQVFFGFPDDQPLDNEANVPTTSIREARSWLKAWQEQQGSNDEDPQTAMPKDLGWVIYELKKVK